VGQVIGGAPVVPGQQGRGGAAAGARGLAGRGQAPGARGAAASPFAGGRVGQAGAGQPGVAGAGPIIGVVSRSTANSIRLYNGRGKYNEWAFVATAATQQAGAPTGAQNPQQPGRGGQQVNPPGRNRGPGGQRGLPFPGRGVQPPGRGGFRGTQPGIQGFPAPGTTSPGR